MEKINNLINQGQLHITTNTLVLLVIAIVAIYILLKAIGNLIKIVAMIGVCWFVLMSLQSTNLVNIPVIKETYTTIEKMIPSKELWTEALDKADKINKVVNDLK
ncbi:hypothetical protein [Clostridium chromiireducens]|uniref:Uncharacterized protein n=1 Tax=Clostridium chromiireducens TaxID=225345 RepID=A0A1V4IXE0_9CLOT|nr:hypothetical protein [Clostridium chromiireducens]MVX64761.1 hypothetical protein [Clostridium chromiireducens]OPJ64732.1 hypothetical protein CLCHR_10850 [Clostridium chromiireducens]RII35965.1 hypothetical protein D2A34_00930 [Clostridium chromiireducens]